MGEKIKGEMNRGERFNERDMVEKGDWGVDWAVVNVRKAVGEFYGLEEVEEREESEESEEREWDEDWDCEDGQDGVEVIESKEEENEEEEGQGQVEEEKTEEDTDNLQEQNDLLSQSEEKPENNNNNPGISSDLTLGQTSILLSLLSSHPIESFRPPSPPIITISPPEEEESSPLEETLTQLRKERDKLKEEIEERERWNAKKKEREEKKRLEREKRVKQKKERIEWMSGNVGHPLDRADVKLRGSPLTPPIIPVKETKAGRLKREIRKEKLGRESQEEVLKKLKKQSDGWTGAWDYQYKFL